MCIHIYTHTGGGERSSSRLSRGNFPADDCLSLSALYILRGLPRCYTPHTRERAYKFIVYLSYQKSLRQLSSQFCKVSPTRLLSRAHPSVRQQSVPQRESLFHAAENFRQSDFRALTHPTTQPALYYMNTYTRGVRAFRVLYVRSSKQSRHMFITRTCGRSLAIYLHMLNIGRVVYTRGSSRDTYARTYTQAV